MATINFTCPHCSHTTQLDSSTEDLKGTCPSCKAEVVITPDTTESDCLVMSSGLKSETPTVEAKPSSDEVKALREKKDQLSTSIRQTVLDPKAKLPEEGSAQQLRSEHVQLTEQAETAKQQAERLTEAKLQVEPLAQECQGLEKELATARESLNEFYQPLGVAAFAGQLAGQIKDVSALADRLVLHEKVTQLQQESEALTPSADAKMLEKTKAKAQQLAAAGKIKIEQTKIGKLDKQSGQQLISDQQEDSVSCEATSAILEQISGGRAEISEKEGKVAESTAAFASSRDEVTKKLALSPFETVADLNTQIKESNTLTAGAQKQLALLERELPDRLMADEDLRSSDSELGQQVQELAEIQAQLKTAGSAIDNAKERLGQFATKIKDAWSGLTTRGKAITVGVIALIAISAAMTTEPGESTGDRPSDEIVDGGSNGTVNEDGSSFGTLQNFDDHPKPILDAVRKGHLVIELTKMNLFSPDHDCKFHYYVVIDAQDKLVATANKYKFDSQKAAQNYGAGPDGHRHIQWFHSPNPKLQHPSLFDKTISGVGMRRRGVGFEGEQMFYLSFDSNAGSGYKYMDQSLVDDRHQGVGTVMTNYKEISIHIGVDGEPFNGFPLGNHWEGTRTLNHQISGVPTINDQWKTEKVHGKGVAILVTE